MGEMTKYGDISEETGIHLNKPFLERALPRMHTAQFAQILRLPKNASQTLKARRYEPLSAEPKRLVEGVTPTADSVSTTDVYFRLEQYGNVLRLTDVVADTHEDPVLEQMTELLGEQAGESMERIRISKLTAGTNVYYANGTSRSAVNTVVTKTMLRRIIEVLKIGRARRITKLEQSTPRFNTVNVKACFICIIHPYMSKDIKDIDGFKAVEDYGSVSSWENEIGAFEDLRFIEQDTLLPWLNAGGTASSTLHSTSGSLCDVFPMLAFGADAYADVALKGYTTKNADANGNLITPVTIMALNPNVPRDGDPLGQRGSVGYKFYWAGGILQDLYMVRGEAAVTK
jgi:N4-gp56 family major capsid protein